MAGIASRETNGSGLSPRRAQLVRDILRLAAQRGWPRGYHVTEQALVAAFGVSRSPVRSALKVLEQRGIVRARPNQGYILARDARDLEAVKIDVPRTAEDDLYLRIIEERSAGALPEKITQSDALRRYDVGRAQLTRVLGRMADEGLVERLKGHGWRFRPTLAGLQSQHASYAFRLAIEPVAMLQPDFAIDPQAITALRERHFKLLESVARRRSVDRAWIYDIDAAFHETIAAASHNPFFIQATQHINRLRRLIEYGGYGRIERVRAWVGEHLAILDALERGSQRKASNLMRRHLANARDAMLARGR